jgi:hypothetical protein
MPWKDERDPGPVDSPGEIFSESGILAPAGLRG